MATTMCEIDGRRPAVATVRIRQNGEERTLAVCEEHLRELQGQSRGVGRSPFGGRSLFDEFFSDFFGDSGLGSRTPGAAGDTTTTRPRRPAEQIDVTQYFSDATRQLFNTSFRTVAGSDVAMTLGWHVGALGGERVLYKEGGGGGFHCMMRLYPESGIGTVVMTNATGYDVRGFLDRTDPQFLRA